MDRREAMKNVALLFGGAISASTMSVLFDSCTRNTREPGQGSLFSPEQETLITEIADTIIPTTKTPGAKAAGVGPFIAMMIDECYGDDDQKAFVKGLGDIDDVSKKKFGKTFVAGTAEQRADVLRQFAEEAHALDEKEKDLPKEKKSPTPFFKSIKELTMLGYFTSEPGATQALSYVAIPGKFVGDYPVKPTDKAWAM